MIRQISNPKSENVVTHVEYKNSDLHTLFLSVCILNIHEIYGNGRCMNSAEYGIHNVMVFLLDTPCNA